MYKQLKRQLEDKRILEADIQGIKDRIKYKIQNQLGLRATTYTELKVECPIVEDKFAKIFSKIEELDNDLKTLEGELRIIEDTLNKVDRILGECTDIEKKVFKCRYIWGLSIKKTAERLSYGEDRVKQVSRDISQK